MGSRPSLSLNSIYDISAQRLAEEEALAKAEDARASTDGAKTGTEKTKTAEIKPGAKENAKAKNEDDEAVSGEEQNKTEESGEESDKDAPKTIRVGKRNLRVGEDIDPHVAKHIENLATVNRDNQSRMDRLAAENKRLKDQIGGNVSSEGGQGKDTAGASGSAPAASGSGKTDGAAAFGEELAAAKEFDESYGTGGTMTKMVQGLMSKVDAKLEATLGRVLGAYEPALKQIRAQALVDQDIKTVKDTLESYQIEGHEPLEIREATIARIKADVDAGAITLETANSQMAFEKYLLEEVADRMARKTSKKQNETKPNPGQRQPPGPSVRGSSVSTSVHGGAGAQSSTFQRVTPADERYGRRS